MPGVGDRLRWGVRCGVLCTKGDRSVWSAAGRDGTIRDPDLAGPPKGSDRLKYQLPASDEGCGRIRTRGDDELMSLRSYPHQSEHVLQISFSPPNT